MKQPKIAIVGASFAGLRAYITLKKKFPKATFYLFDKEEYFTYIPSFHLLLTRPKKLSSSQLSLKKYFGEAFVHEEVISIKHKEIKTKKKTYVVDYTIVCSGAQVNCFGNKDLEKYGYGAKSLPHLKTLWKQLPKAKKIVIIGGGLSGVEYASVLAHDTDKDITLVTGSDMVLPNLAPGGRKYAKRYLERKGVKLIDNVFASAATKNSVTLSDKTKLDADLIMVCTGLKQICPMTKEQEVTNTLHLKNTDSIFMCGDVVRTSAVPTAHSAMIEGDIAASHVIARILNKQPNAREVKKQTTLAVALGPHDGFIQFKSFYIPSIFTGFLKWFIEKSVLFSYKHRIKLFV